MTPEEARQAACQEAFRLFIACVDVASVTRAQWRACCRGEERPAMQQHLLLLAEGAETASLTDRLGLYKAAHATLPLHGRPLREFVGLLMQEQPCSWEWCDALLFALAECGTHDSALRHRLLNALKPLMAQETDRKADLLRHRWVAGHLRLLNLYPDWLPAED